jgi:hypothetical protein
MSYSQVILSENPYAYWDFSPLQKSPNNIIYNDAYGDDYNSGTVEIQDYSIRSNNIVLEGSIDEYKPIVPGCNTSFKVIDTEININNIYGMFFKGTERKNFSLEFFFSIESSSIIYEHNLITIGNLFRCYIKSDKVYLESGGVQVFIPVATWDSSNYVCITYENGVLSLTLNTSSVERIILGPSYTFPDEEAPDIVIGPAISSSNPFFINSLALYSYVLTNDQINRRLAWSNYLPSLKDISAINEGDYFNLIYSPKLTQQKILLTSPDTLSGSLSNNIQVVGDSIQLRDYANPSIIGKSYSLNNEGIRLGPSTYVNLLDLKDSINNSNFSIKMQAKINGSLSNITYQDVYDDLYDIFDVEEETLIEFGPLDNYLSCRLYKSLNDKITLSLQYLDGTEEILLQSTSITNFSTYQNIAINFNGQQVSLKVNSEELTYVAPFPAIASSPYFYLGNSSFGDSPLYGRMKNFTIDQVVDFSEVDFEEVGKYTLKFNNNLNISQHGEWFYSYTPTEPVVSSYVTYNTASKNSIVYVNEVEVSSNTIIPDLNYSTNDPINIRIRLYTDDTDNDLAIFNNLYLVLYEDLEITSDNGLYTISPISTSISLGDVNTEPYILNTENVPILSKPDNIGIKFINGKTSGSTIYPYDDSGLYTIRFVDFVIKLDSIPSTGTYTILDTISTVNKKLTYTSSGLQKTGSFTLYVDGQEVGSDTLLNIKDFYHIAIDFGAVEPGQLFIGSDRDGLNGLSGSIGGVVINNNLPTSVESYLDLKNKALIGRISISHQDSDEINISDSEEKETPIFIDGGKYFEMTTLPKVKIIEDRWQSLSIPE